MKKQILLAYCPMIYIFCRFFILLLLSLFFAGILVFSEIKPNPIRFTLYMPRRNLRAKSICTLHESIIVLHGLFLINLYSNDIPIYNFHVTFIRTLYNSLIVFACCLALPVYSITKILFLTATISN